MRYFLAFLLFSSILLFPTITYSQEPSALHIDSTISSGSATHIGDGLILTVAHIVLAEHAIDPMTPLTDVIFKINSETVSGTAKVVYLDKSSDIAFLRTDDFKNLKQSKLTCVDPKVNDQLTASVFPLNLGRVDLTTQVVGRTAIRNNIPSFLVQMPTIPGMSGGALTNAENEVVGMIEAVVTNQTSKGIMTFGIGLATPGSIICDVLEKYKKFAAK
jgi:S1-C subfamily serine protease